MPANVYTTSPAFRPAIRFHMPDYPEFCPDPETSARTIALRHVRGCRARVRFVRPWAIDCGRSARTRTPQRSGRPRPQPDAGREGGSALPSTFFRTPRDPSVIDIIRGRASWTSTSRTPIAVGSCRTPRRRMPSSRSAATYPAPVPSEWMAAPVVRLRWEARARRRHRTPRTGGTRRVDPTASTT